MAFTTRKSLLNRVREGDEVSWAEFYRAYKPLIFLCGSDCGLTADENEDLLQLVMAEIFRKDIIGNYDPDNPPEGLFFRYDAAKGRFRHYMRKITRNQAIKVFCRRRKLRQSLDDDSAPVEAPFADMWDRVWRREWETHVLAMALAELRGRVRPETYVAFEMYALQERPVREVADFLNISVTSVYTAKSRCVATLKEIARSLEER